MAESAEDYQRRTAAEHLARQQKSGATGKPVYLVTAEPDEHSDKAAQILSNLRQDEPFFIFRAQDILSSFALEAYLTLVEKFNANGPQVESLVDALNDFRTWQTANPDKVKLPD